MAKSIQEIEDTRKERNLLGFLLRRVFDMNLESPSDNFDDEEAEYELLKSTSHCTKPYGDDSRFIITMDNGQQYEVTVKELQ